MEQTTHQLLEEMVVLVVVVVVLLELLLEVLDIIMDNLVGVVPLGFGLTHQVVMLELILVVEVVVEVTTTQLMKVVMAAQASP